MRAIALVANMQDKPNKHSLEPKYPIVLEKRPASQFWQATIRLGDRRPKRISTRQLDLGEAVQAAIREWSKLDSRKAQGLDIWGKPFRVVCGLWLLSKARNAKPQRRKYRERVAHLYFLRYFGKMDVRKIEDYDILQYTRWRKQNYARIVPTNNTLRQEAAMLRSIFVFARDSGDRSTVPIVDLPPADNTHRDAFDLSEWQTIRTKLYAYESHNVRGADYYRRLLTDYVLILGLSGARIGEIRTLAFNKIRVSDANDKIYTIAELKPWSEITAEYLKDFVSINFDVNGKTGQRYNPCHRDILRPLRRRWEESAKENGSLVIAHPNGKPFGHCQGALSNFLKFALGKTHHHESGRLYTSYCFRHTEIQIQILYGALSVYKLALDRGTSLKMLEKHYAKAFAQRNSSAAYHIPQL